MPNRRKMRPGKWGTPRTVVALREAAAATVQRVDLRETTRSAIADAPTGRLIDVQIIEAGWNTSKSRFYPASVLARDIPMVYGAGTHMALDHPGLTESEDRPEGSLRNLAAVFEAVPYTLDGGKTMRVKARVFSAYQQFLSEAWQNIGVSIRGYGEGEQGEAEGHTGTIVTALTEGQSVDFVTHPGAGGRILALLEASRPAALQEATSNELRSALRDALDDAYGENCADDCRAYVSVMDFDTDKGLVWYCQWGQGDNCNYEQAFTVTMAGEVPVVSLADSRTAVVARTVYVPAPPEDMATAEAAPSVTPTPLASAPASVEPRQFTTADLPMLRRAVKALAEAESPELPPDVAADQTDGAPPADTTPIREETGVTVSQTTGPAPGAAGTAEGAPVVLPAAIAEAERARSEAETARDTALREAAESKAAADESKRELARLRATEAARTLGATVLAESTLPQAAKARVLAEAARTVPLTEALALDEAAFKTAVTEAAKAEETYLASLREATGEGAVTGLGSSASATAGPDPEIRKALVESYRARGLSVEAATAAASGRPV